MSIYKCFLVLPVYSYRESYSYPQAAEKAKSYTEKAGSAYRDILRPNSIIVRWNCLSETVLDQ
jgi:hypothetical protein